MSFINELEVLSEVKMVGIRILKPIPTRFPGYSLSIQASKVHYCEPRLLLDLNEYIGFEVAITTADSVTNSYEPLAGYHNIKALMRYRDDCSGVCSRVPKWLVQDLYSWIVKGKTRDNEHYIRVYNHDLFGGKGSIGYMKFTANIDKGRAVKMAKSFDEDTEGVIYESISLEEYLIGTSE
ncbi:MAG: hypothetical protein ACRCX2_13445 [Paraclostridium sp.]